MLRKPFFVTLLTLCAAYTNASAQGQAEPPVRTTYADNGVVKERWASDASGEKNGKYIKYSHTGKVLDTFTYVHGIKNGPASFIDEYGGLNWHTPCRFVGTFKQGNRVGFWKLYLSVAGQAFSEQPDVIEEYDNVGVLLRRASVRNGKPVSIYSYDSQKMRTGPAQLFANGDENTFASGNYQSDKPVGVWQNAALSKSGDVEYKKGFKVTFANGVAASVTDDHGKVTTAQELKQLQEAGVAKAASAKANAQLNAQQFYTLTKDEDTAFLTTSFATEAGNLSGAALMSTKYLTTDAIADLVKLNPEKEKVALILKKAYVMQGNKTPVQLLMQNTRLREETTNPLLRLAQPRVLGEMVYFGLRGFGSDKGIDTGFVIKQVIQQLGSWGDEQKRSIEQWFNATAQTGDIVAYRDTDKYPLRRWLYDQFKADNPYLWMNRLTEDSYTLKRNGKIPANAPDDAQLYPIGN